MNRSQGSEMRLALEGGTPVRSTLLPYGKHSIDDRDIQAVVEVLHSDWLTTGPTVTDYENVFAAAVGARHAVAVSSGTAALHAAAFAAGIGPGDEAVTSPMTFAASANCLLYQGARPVFADVNADTLNIDPAKLEKQITSATRALIPIDYAGLPADLDEIIDVAEARGLIVIEDAAHALGAEYKKRKVGSISSMTVFSTHPVKHIATGEGGVVTTDDPVLAKQLRIFRNHGITTETRDRQSWAYEMVALGYNYRISDIQCALGLAQLGKLDRWLDRRRAIAAAYHKAFSQMPELSTSSILADRDSAWHLYTIQLNLDRLRADRGVIFRSLRAENIGVNVHYIPVPWHPYYQKLGYKKGQWPVAENAYERLLSLPMFPAMTDNDVADVIEAVQKVISVYRK